MSKRFNPDPDPNWMEGFHNALQEQGAKRRADILEWNAKYPPTLEVVSSVDSEYIFGIWFDPSTKVISTASRYSGSTYDPRSLTKVEPTLIRFIIDKLKEGKL